MMRLPGSLREWSFVLVAFLAGCQPNIGDSCTQHTDCSATGNRLCEPNLPGGYCTIFNCEPGGCPGEAACVAYGIAPSVKQECAVQQNQRLERTFCMARCSSNGDCRPGYACVDLKDPEQSRLIGAAVIDTDRGTKVCTVPLSKAAETASMAALDAGSSQVCSPPPAASFPAVPTRGDGGADASVSIDAGRDAATSGDAAAGGDAAPVLDATPVLDAASPPDANGPDARVTP